MIVINQQKHKDKEENVRNKRDISHIEIEEITDDKTIIDDPDELEKK